MARIWTAARRWTRAPVRCPSSTNLAESTFQELSSQTMMATQHASQDTSIEFSTYWSPAANVPSARRNGTRLWVYPAVNCRARPSSSMSRACAGPAGEVTADAARPRSSHWSRVTSRPRKVPAEKACRYVARASSTSMASSRLAACAISTTVSPLPPAVNRIRAWIRSRCARSASSREAASRRSSSAEACGNVPASYFDSALAMVNVARRRASEVRFAASSRKAAAAAGPPRDLARSADRSSSSATSSLGKMVPWARCHARRSRSASASTAPARAPCAARLSTGEAVR
jgi:hypothetical protein